jgi:hypothetical protein
MVNLLIQLLAAPAGVGGGFVILMVVTGLTGLVGLVGEFAKFIFYEQLARRIPNDALADRARFLKWAYTTTLGIALVGGFIGGLVALTTQTPGPGMGAGVGVFACGAMIIGLAFIVFGIMTVFLLVRLRRAIAEQAVLARESWMAVA